MLEKDGGYIPPEHDSEIKPEGTERQLEVGSDTKPRYDLSPAEAHDLTSRMLQEALGGDILESRYGISILDSASPYANLGRYVQAQVFMEKFGNTAEQLQGELENYEANELFITSIDLLKNIPTGLMRATKYNSSGFKTLEDVEKNWHQSLEDVVSKNGLDLTKTYDIGAMAVMAEYRGGRLNMQTVNALYHSLYRFSVQNDVGHWIAILDDQVLRYLQNIGVSVRALEELNGMEYLGSESSTPVHINVRELESGFEAAGRQHFGRIIIHGEGLDDFSQLPDTNE